MKTIKMAPSFGSIDTLIEWPYYMSYFSQPEAKLKKMNITKNLIRLAIGCEDLNKLIKDLQIFNK
jgi:cystathionine beta-lyase/cystathionine gamma-synthase